jgi:hypothetical protein
VADVRAMRFELLDIGGTHCTALHCRSDGSLGEHSMNSECLELCHSTVSRILHECARRHCAGEHSVPLWTLPFADMRILDSLNGAVCLGNPAVRPVRQLSSVIPTECLSVATALTAFEERSGAKSAPPIAQQLSQQRMLCLTRTWSRRC